MTDVKIFKEIELSTHERDTWGHLDLLVLRGRKSDVFDWKYGFGEVDHAENNVQGIGYAVGVFQNFDVDEVTVHFILPRQDLTTKHTFTRAVLPVLQLRISVIAERRRKGGIYNIVPSNCQYCGFKAECPAVREKLLVLANKTQPLELPENFDLSNIEDPAVMAQHLTASKLAKKWAESYAEAANQWALVMRNEKGKEIPGYDYKSKKTETTVHNPAKAWELAKLNGFSEKEFLDHCSVSAATLAKAAGQKAPRGQMGKQEAAFRELLISEGAATAPTEIYYLRKN